MSWEIQWTPKSSKFLKNLDTESATRILNKIEFLKENPFRYVEHYEGEYHKLRIGDYRALIDIDFENKIIIIQVLDKMSRIYKGFNL